MVSWRLGRILVRWFYFLKNLATECSTDRKITKIKRIESDVNIYIYMIECFVDAVFSQDHLQDS